MRDHFLIHFIHKGKGIFQTGDKTYYLEKGDGFLICPDVITYYEADLNDPWHYSWVGFDGLRAERYLKLANLSYDSPVFKHNQDNTLDNIFNQMLSSVKFEKTRNIRLLGLLWLLFSQILETNLKNCCENELEDRKYLYVRKAVEFIESNYSHQISISMVSRYVGLNRSYLNSIFKIHTKNTLKEYLINVRVNKACELLYNTGLSIGEISLAVGYEDPLLFSKAFKKVKDQSPKIYRKCLSDEKLIPLQ